MFEQQNVRWAVVGTSNFARDWLARGMALGNNSELVAVVRRDPTTHEPWRTYCRLDQRSYPTLYDFAVCKFNQR